ncbi:MAG TPA: hypothetical protein VFX02_11515 [Gammaproteobacteria bacterium]|nr:hypothetical protein [Gammaproteobacteria bacterium]
MRVETLLLTLVIATGVYAADKPEPLSLEFLDFLGENSEQDEMLELLIEAEGAPDHGRPEAGADEDD